MMRLLLMILMLAIGRSATAQDQPAGSGAASQPHIQLPAELDRVLRDYEAGWRANDEAALASLFAEDGFILRPRHKSVRGRANIEEAYKNSGGPLHLHAFHYEIADTVAYIIGGYRGAMDRPDAGKFILTLRKNEAGRWLITADMDNGNQ